MSPPAIAREDQTVSVRRSAPSIPYTLGQGLVDLTLAHLGNAIDRLDLLEELLLRRELALLPGAERVSIEGGHDLEVEAATAHDALYALDALNGLDLWVCAASVTQRGSESLIYEGSCLQKIQRRGTVLELVYLQDLPARGYIMQAYAHTNIQIIRRRTTKGTLRADARSNWSLATLTLIACRTSARTLASSS